MVQQVEGSRVQQDNAAELNRDIERLVLRHRGRKCYALMRVRDGKFHAGSTNEHSFTSIGKLYTAGLRNALEWFRRGSAFAPHERSYAGSVQGNEQRDMTGYVVIEYSAVEVQRTPAERWMAQHGTHP